MAMMTNDLTPKYKKRSSLERIIFIAKEVSIIKTVLFVVLASLTTIANAQSFTTQIQYLSGKGKDNMVEWDFFVSDGMQSDKWSKIGVPSCWELQGFGNYNYGFDEREKKEIHEEYGLYKHRFTAPLNWKQNEIEIVFEGVMTDAEVKINGKLAGEIHQGAFYEFKYSITELLLFGEENLDNQTGSFGVGAMQLHNYLNHLRDNSLVITPGDRSDIILGALQANLSENYPAISGIVLTGGILPEPSILKLLEGFESHVPIISVAQGTFDTTNSVGNIKSKIYAKSKQKILTSISLFNAHIDGELLLERLKTIAPKGITPRMFQYNLMKRAKAEQKHIVLPEGEDARIIEAASELSSIGIVTITLLGKRDKIEKKAMQLGFDISHLNIINPATDPNFNSYAETFCELRKHKGVNMDVARDTMLDVSYFGTMMVYKGHADGMVSGAVHTTQHTIRPALQFVKTKPGIGVVSSVFFMCLENRVSVFGDCAINPNPTAEQLAEIAISSAASAEGFGIKAKIAMLSYSSGSSGKGEDVDKVRKATEIVKNTHPHLQIEGPIQYDAAVDPLVGKSKLPDSKVAGEASVLIFPDLNTGNNTYKAVQRETGALAIGPMLQGLNKPVNDLSRGCTVDDVFNTVIVTAIQAQES